MLPSDLNTLYNEKCSILTSNGLVGGRTQLPTAETPTRLQLSLCKHTAKRCDPLLVKNMRGVGACCQQQQLQCKSQTSSTAECTSDRMFALTASALAIGAAGGEQQATGGRRW